MVQKTGFPNAVDVREIITPAKVAAVAGVTPEIAQVVVDAHIFAIRAMVASGATVVLLTGTVWDSPCNAAGKYIRENLRRLVKRVIAGDELAALVAAGMPTGPVPRYDPLMEDELDVLTEWLAQCRIPAITTSDVTATLSAWWELERELADQLDDGSIDVEVVVRRGWEVTERRFEDWLEVNLADALGSNLSLIKRQWRTRSGGIADLVVRIDPVDDPVNDPFEGFDFMVIENKATCADVAAVRQVLRYCGEAEAFFGGPVIPVVAAEGVTDAAQALADELGVVMLTWGELGFMDYLWCPDCGELPIATWLNAFNTGSPFVRLGDPPPDRVAV